jgi:hypothetical protein
MPLRSGELANQTAAGSMEAERLLELGYATWEWINISRMLLQVLPPHARLPS